MVLQSLTTAPNRAAPNRTMYTYILCAPKQVHPYTNIYDVPPAVHTHTKAHTHEHSLTQLVNHTVHIHMHAHARAQTHTHSEKELQSRTCKPPIFLTFQACLET